MARERSLLVSIRSTKTPISINENKDREIVRGLLKGRVRGVNVTVGDMLEMNESLGDERLTAYILGVQEKTVREAISGVMFPDGMLFDTEHVMSITGAPYNIVANEKMRMFGPSRKNNRLTRKDAEKLAAIVFKLSEGRMLSLTQASEKLLVSKSIVERFLFLVGSLPVDRPGKEMRIIFPEDVIKDINERLVFLDRETMIREATKIHHKPRTTGSRFGKLRMTNVEYSDKGSLFGPKNYKSIIQECYSPDDLWCTFCEKIGDKIREENEKNMIFFSKYNNQIGKKNERKN